VVTNAAADRVAPADHDPAHVHVFCNGAELIINLGVHELEVREDLGMKPGDAKAAIRLVEANREALLAEWERIDAQRN